MIRIRRSTAAAVVITLASTVAAAAAGPTTDAWDAVFLAGSKVGHIHTFIEPVQDKGKDYLRVRFDMQLSYKRLDDTVTIKMRYGTIETNDGEVIRLDTRMTASGQEIQ